MNREIPIVAALFVTHIGATLALSQTSEGLLASGAPPAAAQLTLEELLELVAPVALYPDVLIAQILPAATFPTDVVLAARWVRAQPDLARLDEKPWDESVKALCNYPPVLDKMDQDLEWTNALGAAFLAQPEDVMRAIQAGRQQAQMLGLLETNSSQTIVIEEKKIRIVPRLEAVQLPIYDPKIVYLRPSTGTVVAASAISFSAGFALGMWLNKDCYWHGHAVHYCAPGYWGGWVHSGAVAWGPRGVAVLGPNRGFVAGPRGGAAWGPNGGAVWTRPPVATPLPAYSGRYATYNRNTVNVNRGDRTNIIGGGRTGTGVGQLPSRPGQGTPAQLPAHSGNRRPGTGTPTQLPTGSADRRPGASRPDGQPRIGSAFDDRAPPARAGDHSQRGERSRNGTRTDHSSPQRSPSRTADRSAAPRQPSSFDSNRSSRQMTQSSGRGASSRAAGAGGRRGRG